MALRLVVIFGLLLGQILFSLSVSAAKSDVIERFKTGIAAGKEVLVITPEDGHLAEIHAIEKAQSEVIMTMYHLTDANMIKALSDAVQRKVQVRIIVDGKGVLKPGSNKTAFDKMTSLGIPVRGGSMAFSLTHSKTMVIDKNLAFVSSMNMTGLAAYGRDFGVFTSDSKVVSELLAVFEVDWKNSMDGTMVTPPLASDRLLWSPVNSADLLLQLIDSAQSSIETYSENLGSQEILKGLEAAARRHVDVKVIVPLCDLNPGDPFYNVRVKDRLLAAGVHFKLMPGNGTVDVPYIHAKMMLVDDKKAYVGSVNFSMNSLHFARETGMFVTQTDILQQMKKTFMKDWPLTVDAPEKLDPSLCRMSSPKPKEEKPDEPNQPAESVEPAPMRLALFTGNFTFISGRGSSTTYCNGGSASFFCYDNLKRRAKDDAASDASFRCSAQRGVLDNFSGVCNDFCTPFSIPEGRSEFVTCQSTCNFRCDLP